MWKEKTYLRQRNQWGQNKLVACVGRSGKGRGFWGGWIVAHYVVWREEQNASSKTLEKPPKTNVFSGERGNGGK